MGFLSFFIVPKHMGMCAMGRPRKYTKKKLQERIDQYFVEEKRPGVCGLAVYLDVHRDTLREWRTENGPFSAPIKKALDRIQAVHESRLQGAQCSGSIFWLKAQAGWKEQQEVKVEHEGSVSLNINIKGLDGADV